MNQSTPLKFSKSIEFGERIERLIPGGAHTYSKGRDQFPLNAPNGITHGKGAYIWDQDGNRQRQSAMPCDVQGGNRVKSVLADDPQRQF